MLRLINEAFYTTAAAVLPILFVALIVEFRFVDPKAYRKGGYALTQLLVLVALGAGEAASLRALYYGVASHTTKMIVALGLATTGFVIWYTPVLLVLGRIQQRQPFGSTSATVVIVTTIAVPVAFVAAVIYGLVWGI